jgi:hypothetical protein
VKKAYTQKQNMSRDEGLRRRAITGMSGRARGAKDGADVHARGKEGGEMLNQLGYSLLARKIEDPTFRADRVTVIKLLLTARAPIPRTITR